MANRYWVGGTAAWDGTAGTKWSDTSGGAGGATVPTSVDDVFFDANSGANTVTLGSGYNPSIRVLTMTAFTGTLDFGNQNITLNRTSGTLYTGDTTYSVTGTPLINVVSGSSGRTISAAAVTEANSISFNITLGGALTITGAIRDLTFSTGGTTNIQNQAFTVYGNITLVSGLAFGGSSSTTCTLASTSATTRTITTNGVSFMPLNFNGVGGSWKFEDDYLLTSGGGVNGAITLTNGSLNANNKNITCGSFVSSNSNTRTLTMGSGLWTLSGTGTVWNLATVTNLTFNKDTADILLSNTTTTSRTFSGGGLTYNKLTIGGATGTSTLTINGANTFSELASTKTVAHTISFGANQTITTWSVTGTSGNVVTVNSSAAGTARTLTITNRTSGIDYLDVKDITGGNLQPVTFYAGANTILRSNVIGVAATTPTANQYIHVLTSGTSWSTPANWNNSNNEIHLFGGGGSGASGYYSNPNGAGGAGGGGGGYTKATNVTLSGSISYAIGAGGAIPASNNNSPGNSGGNTTFNSGAYSANGGGGGSFSGATPVAGSGGTGSTYNGGTGGLGSTSSVSLTGNGGGGGGGCGGPLGKGGNGGNGFASTTAANVAGGGGGGNGGGTDGGNASSGTGGSAGTNSASVSDSNGAGSAGATTAAPISGTCGIDISNAGMGSGGGRGGSGSQTAGTISTGFFGSGSGGGLVTTTNTAARSGGSGAQGGIIIVYSVGSTNYSLDGANGSYAITGQDATFSLTKAYSLAGEYGSYTITGQDATFDYNPAVLTNLETLIKLRSFTEHRRF